MYLFVSLSVYLRDSGTGRGRFWAKGNKATCGEALPVVHCTERTFSTFVLCTNISKLQYQKKSKSQENWKKMSGGLGDALPLLLETVTRYA